MNKKVFRNLLFLTMVGTTILPSAKAQVGQIIWEENFNTFNSSNWNYVTGNGCDLGPNMCGWGNFELENYQPSNVTVEDIPGEVGNKALVLQAKSQSLGGSSFTSGKITTQNKLAVKYGMIEIRMKAPKVETGLWPAAWLLGTSIETDTWPKCGEIDMMEMGHKASERARQDYASSSANNYVGSNLIWFEEKSIAPGNLTGAASIAYDKWYDTPYVAAKSLDDRFVIYRMYWDEQFIRFTTEDYGVEHDMYTGPFPISPATALFQRPFYFLLNLAVGGSFTDATSAGQVTASLPAKMYVDYIRVRKWNGKGEIYDASNVMANAGSDKVLTSGTGVTLDGSSSYGNISSYIWSENGTQIASGKKTTVNLGAGFHNIVLTVADANAKSATDMVAYTIGATDSIGATIWQEDFNTFDATKWNYVTGNGCEVNANLCGWGNAELEYYQQNNVTIADVPGEPGNKALVIEARKQAVNGSPFTSGKITTQDKLALKYGMVEVRMMAPNVETGLWPAAWLLGVNIPTSTWPKCGEIDMMEMGHKAAERQRQGGGALNNYVGANLIWYSTKATSIDNPTGAASIAYDAGYNSPYTSGAPLSNRFVTYRMYWCDAKIRFTVVDNNVERDLYAGPFPISPEASAFQKPFYFILNLAVGGNFTDAATQAQVTAALPAKMYVDYIKVKKYKGQGEIVTGNTILASAGADMSVTDLDRNGKESVLLDAAACYGNISTYTWSENGVKLGSGKTATVSLSNGLHNITLTITDAAGNISTDDKLVDVREILWEDNFNTLNTSIWNIVTGNGCALGANLCGWGNHELEYYQENNVLLEDVAGETGNKALVLLAKNEAISGSSFTSGKVTTANKVSIKYGLVEVRMKAPKVATGIWPAAWLLGINESTAGWPNCGEIDMMEMGHKASERLKQGAADSISANRYVGANAIWYDVKAINGANPTGAASIAFDQWYNQPYVSKKNKPLDERFVIYRLYWTESSMRFAIEDEGVELDLYTGPFPLNGDQPAFKKPFYFLLNLAVGGDFTDAASAGQVTAPIPAKMIVDYVRVMKYNGQGEVAFANGLIAKAGPDVVLNDTDNNGELVTLDGSGSSSFSGNKIAKYSWSENGVEIATGAVPTVSFTAVPHIVKLTVTDDLGNSATDEVIVLISKNGIITSIGKVLNSDGIDVFPSPVSDVLNVVSKEGEIDKIEVYNISGMKVVESQSSTQVDMSTQEQGVYIVVATINGNIVVKKVVKK